MGEGAQVAVITGTNVLKMANIRKFHSNYKILPHAWDLSLGLTNESEGTSHCMYQGE